MTLRALLLFSVIFGLRSYSQSVAQLPLNQVFRPGEIVSYEISYNWGFIWVDAGVVEFRVKSGTNSTQYAFSGIGRTYPRWDWVYKVRDEYHSTSKATSALQLVNFERKVREGSTFIHNKYSSIPGTDSLKFISIDKKGVSSEKSIRSEPMLNDVLSMIYKARTFKFSHLRQNDTIPIKLLLDGDIHNSYIRYLGTEVINSDVLGKVNCYKFTPLLIEGTIFNAGEDMTVWVSADKNRIPVMIETPILVGNIKAILKKVEGEVSPYKKE